VLGLDAIFKNLRRTLRFAGDFWEVQTGQWLALFAGDKLTDSGVIDKTTGKKYS